MPDFAIISHRKPQRKTGYRKIFGFFAEHRKNSTKIGYRPGKKFPVSGLSGKNFRKDLFLIDGYMTMNYNYKNLNFKQMGNLLFCFMYKSSNFPVLSNKVQIFI